MKTKTNNPTRSKSVCHDGKAADDTKVYEIAFSYKLKGKRYIRANAPAEARQIAARIAGQIGFWRDCPETHKAEILVKISHDAITAGAIYVETSD
jgi:hypothetical protein